MGRKLGDEIYELEGRIEYQTRKAVLVEFTNGQKTWVPKSQIVDTIETQDEDVKVFHITQWFAEKEGL